MIKIRWITWWPAPYWTDRFKLMAQHQDLNLEVLFIRTGFNLQNWRVREGDLSFKHKILSKKIDMAGHLKFKFEIPEFIDLVKGRYDAVVIQYGDMSCIFALFTCILLRRNYFIFAPNTKFEIRKETKIKNLLKRIIFSQARGILATGPDQKEYVLGYTKAENKTSIIGNPSQSLTAYLYLCKKRNALRKELGLGKGLVLLYVGRFSGEKGGDELLRAFKRLSSEGHALTLVMVGEGPEKNTFQSKVEENRVGPVVFPGFLQKEELSKYYASADIFVLPSETEAWGLVVNEAMEFGLPLVLSDRVGCRRVLLRENLNGFSFPSGNVAKLAACIRQLCEDRNLREEMGMHSRRIIKAHTIENWVANVYRSIKSQIE